MSLGIGGMSGPFEYREMMKAHMRYNETRTVEEVMAAQKKRHERPAKGSTGLTATDAATPVAALPQSEVDKVRAMLANAPPRPAPLTD